MVTFTSVFFLPFSSFILMAKYIPPPSYATLVCSLVATLLPLYHTQMFLFMLPLFTKYL